MPGKWQPKINYMCAKRSPSIKLKLKDEVVGEQAAGWLRFIGTGRLQLAM